MTFLTANNQKIQFVLYTFVTTHMAYSFHSHFSSMPHVTPPGFKPGPPAPLASTLTTRPWLVCNYGFPKKFIHDIPMVRVSRSIFKIIFFVLNHDTTKVWNGLVNYYKVKNQNLETLFNPLSPPKKCLIWNNFLLNFQDCSMRFIES